MTDRSLDPEIPAGNLLLAFTDASLERLESLAEMRRRMVGELGVAAMVEASGVIGNFSMMNRIADSTGMPMGPRTMEAAAEIRRELGLDRLLHD